MGQYPGKDYGKDDNGFTEKKRNQSGNGTELLYQWRELQKV